MTYADITGRKEKNGCPASVRPRVVVVDDDPAVGGLLSGALNRDGFEVEVFCNSIAALEAFDDLKADLLVADWIMPGLDGLTLIDSLRDRYPSLPAMLITSYGDHDDVRQACEAGRVDAILSKPFDLRNFLLTVRSFLDKEVSRPEKGNAVFEPGGVWISGSPRKKLLGGWSAVAGRETYFEMILESVLDAVLMVEKNGRISYLNRGAMRIFGFTGQQKLSSLSLGDICPVDSPLLRTLADFFRPHPPVEEQSEAFFKRLDGERFYSIYSSSLFWADSQEPSLLLVIKDINDCLKIEEWVSEKNRNLEILAITDPLTGLYNRRHLDHRLGEEFRRVDRYKSALSLVMIDFDYFKRINDLYGHLTGDKVLQAAARIMAKALRDVDTLARWGGEEFMALLPETNAETGLAVVRRLHRLLGDQGQWAKLCPDLDVTVSIGLVSLPWPDRPSDIEMALEILDQALYKAKNHGRNCIVQYFDQTDSFAVA